MSLHIGWAIEGVVGSEYKIDPTYLSPNISLSLDLLQAYSIYNVPLMMSEDFYILLSVKAKSCCRRINTVITPYT